jgi:hypothetical protein
MSEFLSDPFVQMVMAVCTFIGGIVAVMQLFAWYSDEGNLLHDSAESRKIGVEGMPRWIFRERNILKKSYNWWQFKIARIVYSGQVSGYIFLELAYQIIVPYFLLVVLAITFPYLLIAVFTGIAVFSLMINLGKDDDFQIFIVFSPMLMFGFFYAAPHWFVNLLFPATIIMAVIVAWQTNVFNKVPDQDWVVEAEN